MRTIQNINNNWYFSKQLAPVEQINKNNMEAINLPHTWNAIDGQDGGNDYYRGVCVYYKELDYLQITNNQEVYLEFVGVAMTCSVFINNQFVCKHQGGFSTFRANITNYLKKNNTLVIYVDNKETREVYPQKADFTFYGGIYRDVNLIVVDHSHFELDYYGGSGLAITSNVNGNVVVDAYLTNSNNKEISFEIVDANNNIVAASKTIVENNKATSTLHIDNVILWDGINNPYLYTLRTSIDSDAISSTFGVRSYQMDANKGFILNGKEYPLIGVSRHQDYKGVGNALTKNMHEQDFEIMKEMGVRTIRLAHYQHDPYVYDLADRYGFIVWAEIPYISEHMEEGNANSEEQLKELIIQNYNHPSIVCWGLSNEITVTGGESKECYENHIRLNNLAHSLDKTRVTTMANLFMLNDNSPYVSIPDIRSYNLYYGWYVGNMEENDAWFDKFHQNHPTMVIGLSEYGADANPSYQAEVPNRGDYSESYQALYHEHMLKMRESRPYIWAMHVWNMFDFAADGRNEGGKKGENQKGLVTFDRTIKKDAFYIYKAYLSSTPFVHICGKRYVNRHTPTTIIKVYSNLDTVSLYVDGQLVETKTASKVFEFEISISSTHTIKAIANDCVDMATINKVEEKDLSYICPDRMEIVNWFDVENNSIDETCFSIKDKVKDIKAHKVAGAIYAKMMEMAMASMGDVAKNTAIPKEMQERMDNMTLEENLKMAGHLVKPAMVEQLNKTLQQIKK